MTPLIEMKKGMLEVHIHLYVGKEDKGLTAMEPQPIEKSTELTSAYVAKFWYGMDRCQFDAEIRAKNKDELSLFMFDVINSLSEKESDYLIHARLAHLPRKAILQMIKNDAKGVKTVPMNSPVNHYM